MTHYQITNRSEQPRRFAGVWVKPGETKTVEMRAMPAVLIAKWRRAGVAIRETEVVAGAVAPLPTREDVEAEALGFSEGDHGEVVEGTDYTICHRGGGRYAAMRGDEVVFGLASRDEVERWVEDRRESSAVSDGAM